MSQSAYKCKVVVHPPYSCWCWKGIFVNLFKWFFVDFVMQHARPMLFIIFSSVVCLPLQYLLLYFK